MIEWQDARALAHALGSVLAGPAETVDLADAAGRTIIANISALAPLPGYPSSAMDGWAVAGEPPWRLGRPILAGDEPTSEPLAPGTARAIATGGPVPPGTRGVLRSEHGTIGGDTLEPGPLARADEPRAREHIRDAGEEAGEGEALLVAGSLLTPPRIALAAAAGHDRLRVAVAPGVDVVLLGAEIIDTGVPRPGQVRDAYAPQLPALLGALGARPGRVRRVPDSLDATIAALAESDTPLMISTGGTASGPADHVHEALAAIDAEPIVDGVNMRPGHPVVFARRADGRVILCLPGNPLAAMLCLVSLGVPLIDGALGRPLSALGSASLVADAANRGSRTRLLAVRRTGTGVEPTAHQGSGMLRGLAEADAIAVIPPGGALADELVGTLPLPW